MSVESSEDENRKEFFRLKDECYLDHAGAALYSDLQMEAIMTDMKENLYGNPHSLNLSSKRCHDAVDQIRFEILNNFGTNPDEYSVIFTSGATAALKSVAEWFAWNDRNDTDEMSPDSERGRFVYAVDNHTSVLGMREVVTQRGVRPKAVYRADLFRVMNGAQTAFPAAPFRGLFVYSAMCNFSGYKYPLNWIAKVRRGVLDSLYENSELSASQWYTLLDAATYASTNKLDLSRYKPDFVAISFYKIFGYPTGLGALLVKNTSACLLNKRYYGGGTVLIALSDDLYHVKRPLLHEMCEDGTTNFLSIISLRHGFRTLYRFGGTDMCEISLKVFKLAQYLCDSLLKLHHRNCNPVAVVYRDTSYDNVKTQGGIVNFNLLRDNGDYVGYNEVLNIANLYGIHLRTGCFCNPGACQRHLKLSNEVLLHNFKKGHTCADNVDLIEGLPTGSIRVSFGYSSTKSDVDRLLRFIIECYATKPVCKVPDEWPAIHESYVVENGHLEEPEKEKLCMSSLPSKPVTRDDSSWTTTAYLSRIYVYPIKSCGFFEVRTEWSVTESGLAYDRQWMVVTENGIALTQKQCSTMCLISPILDVDDGTMTLRYVGSPSSECNVKIPLNENDYKQLKLSTVCQSKVCDDRVQVADCGESVALWISSVLRLHGLRLVRYVNRKKFLASKQINLLSLANQEQILLITESSVRWLLDQMQNTSFILEEMILRFRSNFVISGKHEALSEYSWRNLDIGNVHFEMVGACNRCQMICVNQLSGEKNREPLTALARALKGRIKFGVYLRKNNRFSSTIKVNDKVTTFY